MRAATTSLHIYPESSPPKVDLFTYTGAAPIGRVALDDGGITVASKDPAALRLVAEAFTDAARQLSNELDKAAARDLNSVPA